MTEDRWSEKQRNVQYALATGNLSKLEISKKFDVARQTIYNWLKDDTFVTEVGRIRQDLQNFGKQLWYSNYIKSITNIIELGNSSPDQRVRLNASIYNVEVLDGKLANQINVTNEVDNRKEINVDILEQEQLRFEQQMIEEANKNK